MAFRKEIGSQLYKLFTNLKSGLHCATLDKILCFHFSAFILYIYTRYLIVHKVMVREGFGVLTSWINIFYTQIEKYKCVYDSF